MAAEGGLYKVQIINQQMAGSGGVLL